MNYSMVKETGCDAAHAGRTWAALSVAITEEMVLFAKAGHWDQLENTACVVAKSHPEQLLGWFALSQALLKSGKWTQAINPFSRVIELSPGNADAHSDLGYVFVMLGREEEAEASYRRALACNPGLAKALNNLGALLIDQGRLAEAAVILRQALEINPDSDYALYCMGMLLDHQGGRDDEAMACLEHSISLNPGNVTAYRTLGDLLLRAGQLSKARDAFLCARKSSPLVTWPARKEKADFSVLMLYAPGPGCTPVHYLVRKASYDCHFYCVLPDAPDDADFLRAKADVVINLIADADNGRDTLPPARDLVQRLGRPVVNHPDLVLSTDRASIARRLEGIPLCRIPKTIRLAGPVLAEAVQKNCLDGFSMPLLVRVCGNHGGDEFEKTADLRAIADFVSRRPGDDYYLTQYLDCRSADGYFRKYRLICIDGELFPYHLAIGDDWKVHHFRTDMGNQAWMRREEEAFLKDPRQVFDAPHQVALRAASAATGLDYCGIDCALDRDGGIVVFEANAAMLVHDEKDAIFAYKNRYIAKIKHAFDRKLTRLAIGSGT